MKKYAALALLIVLVLLFSGCGKQWETEPENSTDSSKAVQENGNTTEKLTRPSITVTSGGITVIPYLHAVAGMDAEMFWDGVPVQETDTKPTAEEIPALRFAEDFHFTTGENVSVREFGNLYNAQWELVGSFENWTQIPEAVENSGEYYVDIAVNWDYQYNEEIEKWEYIAYQSLIRLTIEK